MNINVIFAVFKRNLISYFANPTGYVFICVFVVLSSLAAFWPPDFFNNNLANLDQLNIYFPLVMLFFIPAITMSIWADERRQGTDELLLTVPAGDFDIVLGKYLAAVAIFTVALLFSLVCNCSVLTWLSRPGLPDLGLFLCTYIGYWFVGLAMLSVGMMASFLTGNLTVSFVLGAILNAPLVFLVYADAILSPTLAAAVRQWSIGAKFNDFGRGVFSLAAAVYFLTIVAVMLYLSMVLIGRRHWSSSGIHRANMVTHYALRALSLAVIAVGIVILVGHHDVRFDMTSEKLSSLSPETRKLLVNLDPKSIVQIEAFISPEVPESYVQTRLNLLSALSELQARSDGRVQVRVFDTDRFSENALIAQQRYSIEPRRIVTRTSGKLSEDYLFLYVVVNCGTKRIGPTFIDRGIPVEYELVRSIATASGAERKKVGVLQTDAQMYGAMNFQTGGASPNWPIIDELEKQYTVVKIDPTKPITEKFDVLLAVQPSSLGPEEMNNFLAYVGGGAPTAIFEDPFPYLVNLPASTAPRQAPGGMNPMMMMGRGAPPKGNIAPLWNMLGVDFSADQIVWQKYNPYPKLAFFGTDPEWVFVDRNVGTLSNASPISSGLQQLLLPFPGSITKLNSSPLEFTPLVKTSDTKDGTVAYKDLMPMSMMGMRELNPNRRFVMNNTAYPLSAKIKGDLKRKQPMAGEEAGGDEPAAPGMPEGMPEGMPGMPGMPPRAPGAAQPAPVEPTRVNVVLTADVDMLSPAFFKIREMGDNPEAGVNFNFDNVTYVLNIIDDLAGDQRFLEIRKRRPTHHTLQRIEQRTKDAREKAMEQREDFAKAFDKAEQQEREALEAKLKELQSRKGAKDPIQLMNEIAVATRDGERRIEAKIEKARKEKDSAINVIETDLSLTVQRVQSLYKFWAVFLPPMLPLALAVIVYGVRRSKEREGVARSRLR